MFLFLACLIYKNHRFSRKYHKCVQCYIMACLYFFSWSPHIVQYNMIQYYISEP